MLTLGFWLFVIALAALFLNNTSWFLLPIFFVLYVFAIKIDKKWEKEKEQQKKPYVDTQKRILRKSREDYRFVIINKQTGIIYDRYETLQEAEKAKADYCLKDGDKYIVNEVTENN